MPSLSNVKVCGYPSGEGAVCEMQYCGFAEALAGTCSTGREKGCCVTPESLVLDELRHNFLLNYTMKMFTPYMGLWVPFWAATLQALVRMLPSAQLGLLSNPNPHLLRAVLSGDYSSLHLVIGTITLAQFLSTWASKGTWNFVGLVGRMLARKSASSATSDSKKTKDEAPPATADKAKHPEKTVKRKEVFTSFEAGRDESALLRQRRPLVHAGDEAN
mmetsp:Transcript_39771/g.81436  ORF Transcript_39771/g.81436 Transcript_39771/m.81436 type:complete len:217 (-) Transcript_39771:238-888(-)